MLLSFFHLILNHFINNTVFCLHGCVSIVSKNRVSRDLPVLPCSKTKKNCYLNKYLETIKKTLWSSNDFARMDSKGWENTSKFYFRPPKLFITVQYLDKIIFIEGNLEMRFIIQSIFVPFIINPRFWPRFHVSTLGCCQM